MCDEAYNALQAGANVLILSDRRMGRERAPIPSLLQVSAVHHHLVRAGNRLQCSLVLESGEPREVHHMATLIGFGCGAINPYLLFDTVATMFAEDRLSEKLASAAEAERNVVKAIGKGLLKTISKMGISTIQSYCGAQIFEAVGLEKELIDRHFTGTASRIGGIGIDVLAQEALDRHARAFPAPDGDVLPVGGVYAWRRDGEHHMWNPETIALVQHAVRSADGDAQSKYDEFAERVNSDATRRATLRGLMTFRTDGIEPIDIDEVEPAKEIVKRFATGAMSLGSISRDAHETLAKAMNHARRPLEHRRGRRGPGALHRRPPLGDQAGRLRPLRRDDPLPGQRRPAADQDGPGRQARRGRPAARPQGRQVHRRHPPLDAGRRA